ncbi:SNF2-related protein [Marinospirillum minutulum]|uniref:SNF2-related protein n=1 Tax=Marinospirillum minutulum TaxID=64974 RepID=UPI000407C54F|nr:SNF2-related protein [Marinospirillum minutulum]
MISEYHAKYFAYELTRQKSGGDVDRISSSLFDAAVDLNPHQIDAALFALQNPLSKGVLLADEVGLGKTIEAALVLCQYWAERRRHLLVICPAALRKQWANELSEKFHLPTQVLDARTYKDLRKEGIYNPFDQQKILIVSYHYAARMADKLRTTPWDLVVIDEAHKLRNAHRESNVLGQAIKSALVGSRKLLLTATPLQNSLIELYGLSTLIDEQLFGDLTSFRKQFIRNGPDITGLRHRLKEFSQRTLRRQVFEYIKYTERKAITIPFSPSDEEQRLYDLLSAYLQRSGTYGVPRQQRHLVSLVIRKLLASSTEAVIQTLSTLLKRLNQLKEDTRQQTSWFNQLISEEELDEEWLDELELEESPEEEQENPVDLTQLQGEIAELESYLTLAQSIKSDVKTHALVKALEIGFERMSAMGAARKAVIFTESRRTQDYLQQHLEQHGYANKTLSFSGTNASAAITGIYQRWIKENQNSDKITGSPAIDKRSAIIDYFKTDAEILIATEAAAEGINLQFCSLVINYDLPWNPQRIEQRIGRCHRYGQKHDVVVINFLNQRNSADQRVIELLTEKLELFEGLFGASDELIGHLEANINLEKRMASIYDTCRTPKEIQTAFDTLQEELEESISKRLKDTEEKLLENFDEQVHERLRLQKEKAVAHLDKMQRMFWQLTRFVLKQHAAFNEQNLTFNLQPTLGIAAPTGEYQLIQKNQLTDKNSYTYRLTHPLGEYVLNSGRTQTCPLAKVTFDLSGYAGKISVLENLTSKTGWLALNLLELESFQREEHLVFSGLTDANELLDQEACERLFNLTTTTQPSSANLPEAFNQQIKRQLEVALSKALEENTVHFKREQEKLEAWAEDQLLSAEQALEDTKIKLRDAKRQARLAASIEEQKTAQETLKKLENQQRKQRNGIFDVEDAIEERRDQLITALEKRMHQQSHTQPLFKVQFEII